MYRESVDGACGHSSNVGPFYCSGDGVVYLQTPFLEQLWRGGMNYGVAAILAHEIGHHVQRTSGVRVAAAPNRAGQVLSIQAELGADCLGGVWAADAARRGWLPVDGVEQAREITSAAGDLAGTSRSDPRAHGTSEQRLQAFTDGFADCSPQECLAI